MPTTCLFQLDSHNGVYYSGQTVSGQVTLRTTSEKNVRKIRIRLLGIAKVHWKESESYTDNEGKRRTRAVHYNATQIYVDNSTIVRGRGTLPPGTYTYTFSIPLSDDCAASAKGEHGSICYSLCLTVDRPLHFDNEFSRSLTVLRTVDLNLNPAHKIRLQCEEVNSIGCWPCCVSGNILYNLTIPYSAFTPGQTLRYSLQVQNQSMADITGYRMDFTALWTFTAHFPRRKKRYYTAVLVRKNYRNRCLRQTSKGFESGIVLPSMMPTTEGSSIVRLSYWLTLEMFIDGFHKNNKLTVPIFIGNVAIRETLPGTAPTAPVITSTPPPSVIIDQPTPLAHLLPPAFNENDAPPSYAELEELQPPSFQDAIES